MASLTGNLVAETYKALLKTIDNDILTASEKQITDGFGGGSNIFIDSQGFIRANKYKVTNGLATQFLKADGSLDTNTYLTSITGAQVITALGFTPVTNQRTLTINGVTYNLTANRTWTIEGTAAVWGNITGTLSNQTDLQNALNAKYNIPAGTITQYIRGDGSIANFPTLPGGLPIGGTAGQILSKIDATDYNAQWIDNFATQTKNEVKLAQTLTKGTAVYVSSANGTNIIVSAASNASEALSSKTFGLLETGGATNDLVKCVTFGLLAGLDTSAATAGDPVWLGVNGALLFGLANKPVAPANMVYIGVVTRVQSNNGEIFVNVQNGFEIEELHDVLIQSKVNNQGLFYESSTGLWKNKSITDALGFVPQRVDNIASSLFASATNYPNNNAVIAGLALKADAANPVFTGSMNIVGLESRINFYDENNLRKYFIGYDSGTLRIFQDTGSASRFYITPTGQTFIPGTLTVGSVVKDGGTASQFLKADGSIDSNTYVQSSALADYLLISTAASTYQRLDRMAINLLASDIQYPNNNAVIAALALKADAANPVFTGFMTISGAEPRLYFVDTDNNPDYTIFIDSGIFYIYDQTAGATRFSIGTTGNINAGIGKSITAGSFIKDGGTASQFLKADGSIDSNTYVSSSALANYLLISTATSTYQRLDNIASSLFASATNYPNNNAVIAGLALKADAANPVFTGSMNIRGLESRINFYDENNLRQFFIGYSSGTLSIFQDAGSATRFQINSSGNITTGINNTITSWGFVRSGGTSSQFLMADGSVSLGPANNIIGGGSQNYITKFDTAGGNSISNSVIKDDGLMIEVQGAGTVLNGGWSANQLNKSIYPVIAFQSTAVPVRFAGIGYEAASGSGLHFWVNSTTLGGISTAATRGLVLYNDRRVEMFGALTVAGSVIANGQVQANTIFFKNSTGSTDIGYFGSRSDWTGGPSVLDMAIGSYRPSLCFFTNNSTTESMRITSTSNLLIGTTTDEGYRLDVAGQIRSFSATPLVVSMTSNSANDAVIAARWQSGTGIEMRYFPSQALCYFDSTYPATSGEVFGDMRFRVNSGGVMTSVMTIKSNNLFVGIGTTIPSSPLHIQSSVSNGQVIRSQTTIAAGRNYMQWANPSGDMGYVGYGGGDSRLFFVNQLNADMIFSTNSTTRMTITAGGQINLGGTADFIQVGNDGGGTYFETTGSSDARRAVRIQSGNSTFSQYSAIQIHGANQTVALNTSNTTRLFISSGGFVGIGTGTATPSAPIHASGGNAMSGGWVRTAMLSAIYPVLAFNSNNTRYAGIGYDFSGSQAFIIWVNAGSENVSTGTAALVITGSAAATFASTVTATGFFESSDLRLKTLIDGNPIIKGIENLQAKLYEKDGKIELGYFAQDAELIMPYAVTKNMDGFLNLSYREVHTAKIARLEQRVAELEKQLNLN